MKHSKGAGSWSRCRQLQVPIRHVERASHVRLGSVDLQANAAESFPDGYGEQRTTLLGIADCHQ
jgi:hypothetical protein